jgi:DNA polymerase I-like protein with 3'-5' exonuclease and polymerase domains
MGFFNTKVDTKKKKAHKKIYNTIYSGNSEIEYTFIIDRLLKKDEINILRSNIELFMHADQYQILYPFTKAVSVKDYQNNFKKFRKVYSATLDIPKNSKIMVFGKTIDYLTQSSDISVNDFTDHILQKTSFYSPDYQCEVFPVNYFNFLFKLDDFCQCSQKQDFDYYFFKSQLKLMANFEFKPYNDQIKCVYVENPNEFLLLHTDRKCKIGIDIETIGLNPWENKRPVDIICVTLTFDGRTGYYLDFKNIDKFILNKFLENKGLIGSNLKFDCKWLHFKASVELKNLNIVGDTINLCRVVNELRRKGLKSVAYTHTSVGGYDRVLDDYLEKYPNCKKDYSLIPFDILFPYATKDPCVSFLEHERLLADLRLLDKMIPNNYLPNSKWSMERYYNDIIIEGINTFLYVETTGMIVDYTRVENLSKRVLEEINDIKLKLKKSLGIDDIDVNFLDGEKPYTDEGFFIKSLQKKKTGFNVDSDEQLGLKFEDLKWPCLGRSKKGVYLVNKITLDRWLKNGYKEAELVLKLHKLTTLFNTFIGEEDRNTGYWQYRGVDDRVHSSFGVSLTDSGRNFSRSPNLQNLPSRGYLSEEIRSMFIPPSDDYLILEADGKGLQLHIEAAISRCPRFGNVFKNDGDLHTETGYKLFYSHITKNDFYDLISNGDKNAKLVRYSAKAPNFSLIFNTTDISFATQTLMTGPYAWKMETVKEYIKINNLEDEVFNSLTRIQQIGLVNEESFYTENELKYYLTAAKDIKDKFFAEYPGVKRHITKRIADARKTGYVQSPFGIIRRLPYLYSYNYNEFTDDFDRRKIKNNENISTNTDVQLFEAFLIINTMNELRKYIVKHNKKSLIIGQVHDSIVLYIHKDEIVEISEFMKNTFEFPYPENRGIPQELEFKVGKVWGFGKEMNFEELKKEYL